MYVILSNNGNWSADTLGVVGVCPANAASFKDFVESHGDFVRGSYEMVSTGDAVTSELDDREIDLIAEGAPVLAATCEDLVYVAIQL